MKKIFLVGTGLFLLWGCQNTTEQTGNNDEAEALHHSHETPTGIELNEGEKWVVNDEMKPFIQKGAELVDAFIADGQSDYKRLAEQVKDQNTQLIKSCTMDGKSHDELHKWLHPHLDLVKRLETDSSSAPQIVKQLQDSYRTYHRYFN